jgi:hypothetical protein
MQPAFATKVLQKRSKTGATAIPNAEALNLQPICGQRWRHLKATQASCAEADNQVHHAQNWLMKVQNKRNSTLDVPIWLWRSGVKLERGTHTPQYLTEKANIY